MKLMVETKVDHDLSCFKKRRESGGVTPLRDVEGSKQQKDGQQTAIWSTSPLSSIKRVTFPWGWTTPIREELLKKLFISIGPVFDHWLSLSL